MTQRLNIRFLAILFAMLFLLGQGLASAHAAEYGSDHKHDDVVCSVSILGEDEADLQHPPETVIIIAPIIATPVLQPKKQVAFENTPQGRAPPPRAPPL